MGSINLFIPETLKYLESGFLSGQCLMGDCQSTQRVEPPLIIIDEKVQQNIEDDSIGEIMKTCLKRTQSKSMWVIFETQPTFTLSSFILNGKAVNVGRINLVFYNSLDIRNSYLLCHSKWSGNSVSENIDHFIQRVARNDTQEKRKSSRLCGIEGSSLGDFLLWIVFSVITLLRKFNEFLIRGFDSKSFAIEQILHRFKQISKLRKSYDNREDLVWKRIIGVLFFDVLLGFLSCYYIHRFTSASELHLCFHASTEVAASNVQYLLNWLRGAPAGLKLNQPLTESLASFSSYHVYLWTLYLEGADPVLTFMMYLFMIVGFFGISLQVAFLLDFLNLVVLHIHCIYIYAARLHMLQMSLLGSQWRAFRGHKWNPLKERVDTPSDRRRRPLIKVFSAVGFTLVIFLLPTTTVYYLVFLTLRLVLMGVQSVVLLLLWALNANPVSIVFLHMIRSPLLKGQLHIEMQDASDYLALRPIYLCLTVKASPLNEAIDASHCPDVFPARPWPNSRRILNSLLYAKELL